ncbi:MAG: nucleoside-diphosphate kinase [Acidobacteria bacterium]|nr:nucleoside-diphosphate kinase [Acidobacteriota bacterium]
MVQRTLTIIKPDGVEQKSVGAIIAVFEKEGFRILAARMLHMSKAEAEGFYAVHKGKKFFEDLTRFMSSGPCLPMVLEREEAIPRLRELMGATDPAKAADGTIRKKFAANVERNVIHGSDSPESAADEMRYFFPTIETGR